MWVLFFVAAALNFHSALMAGSWSERLLHATVGVLFLGIAAARYLDARSDAR